MEKQYIYILSNAQQPDVVKVGKTNIHPEIRAKDITKGAGVIGKWQVEWYIVVPDADIAEKMAH